MFLEFYCSNLHASKRSLLALLVHTQKRRHPGPMRQLRSDQGANFAGGSNELKTTLSEMNQDTLKKEMARISCLEGMQALVGRLLFGLFDYFYFC